MGPTANLGSILYLGGIVGFSKGSIKNCTNDADIALTSSYSKKSRLGGIAGTCDKSSTDTLKDLKNNGSIMGGAYVGGIVGDGFEGQSRIINAENYGIVSGGVNVGGVCGQRCFVQNGENRGNIVISDGSANMYVGGIVGFWGSELGSLNYGEINIVSDSGAYVGGVDGCPFI